MAKEVRSVTVANFLVYVKSGHFDGTIAMARTQVADSATSQFFINLVDNVRLDFTAATAAGWGYAVFGR